MIRPIVKDPLFLSGVSEKATSDDIGTARDLMDTIISCRDRCVGMAANMIGVRKRILVFDHNGVFITMFNPVITAKKCSYRACEGCLSLNGTRETVRYREIKIVYQTVDGKKKTETFRDFSAQIFQHEMDHFDGILI